MHDISASMALGFVTFSGAIYKEFTSQLSVSYELSSIVHLMQWSLDRVSFWL